MGSRRGKRETQQHEFACQVGRHLQPVETLGLLDQFGGGGGVLILSVSGQRFGVVGDEVVRHPAGMVQLDAEFVETGFGLFHELFSFCDGGSGGGLSLQYGGEQHEQNQQQKLHRTLRSEL